MKKMMIAALVLPVFAHAGLPSVTFEGKKITVEDTRATLIKKLGKPADGTKDYSHWQKSNYAISASYDQYGLRTFEINQLRPAPGNNAIVVNGKTFYLGKDSLKTAVGKLRQGCFDVMDAKFSSTYSFIVRDGAEGEINVGLKTEYVNNSKTASLNQPIQGVVFSYDELDASEGCTQ